MLSDLHNFCQVSSQVWRKALWNGSGVDPVGRAWFAATTCKGLSVMMSQQTNWLKLWFHMKNMCTGPLRLPAFDGSWSVLYSDYQGVLMAIVIIMLMFYDRNDDDDDNEDDCRSAQASLSFLWSNIFLSSVAAICLYSLLSVLPLFRTNWCCLCANMLSRNTA